MSEETITPSRGRLVAGTCLATAAIVTCVFVVATRYADRAAPLRFAVVDLAAVVRASQASSVATLSDKEADQAAKAAALARTQRFGQRLDREIAQLSAECACVLLMREAVVAGQLEDLTATLSNRLAKP